MEGGALGVAARDPHAGAGGQTGEGGLRGVRVGGLGVVHPVDAAGLGDGEDAVGAGGEGAQARGHGLGPDGGQARPEGEGGSGEGVGDDVGGEAVGAAAGSQVGEIVEGGDLAALAVAGRVQGAVHEEALDAADLPQGRRPQGEADGEAALDDVGVGDHGAGRLVLAVVDGGALGAGVDAGLVSGVGLGAAMPVEMVGGHVEAGRGGRREGPGGVELEAGQLNGKGVGLPGQDGGDDRVADVADGWRGEPGGGEDGREHADRCRLAIGAGDGQPGDVRAGRGALEAPGELDLGPGLDAGGLCGGEDRAGGGDSRGDHEEAQVGGHQGSCAPCARRPGR